MTTIIVLVVVVLLIAAGVLWWTRRSAAERADRGIEGPVDPLADGPGGPLEGLGVGAVVSHGGHDYVVRGEVRFDEDGYVWTEYHLDAGAGVRTWLSVDVSDGTEVAFWQALEAPGDLAPDGGTVDHDGVSYHKVESGRARFTSTGTTGLPDTGRSWYADYESADDRLLSFERWSEDGSWEVSTGTEVPAHLLEVYPAGRTAGGTL